MYARMTKFVGLAPERIDATVSEFEQNAAAAREQAITTGQAGPRRDAIVDHFEVVLHRQSA